MYRKETKNLLITSYQKINKYFYTLYYSKYQTAAKSILASYKLDFSINCINSVFLDSICILIDCIITSWLKDKHEATCVENREIMANVLSQKPKA